VSCDWPNDSEYDKNDDDDDDGCVGAEMLFLNGQRTELEALLTLITQPECWQVYDLHLNPEP
jgi:hypothetical protein